MPSKKSVVGPKYVLRRTIKGSYSDMDAYTLEHLRKIVTSLVSDARKAGQGSVDITIMIKR
ncbi:hypothetical protein D3C80_2014250 [compost metagenome]